MRYMKHITISHQYVSEDGRLVDRSKLEDISTLQRRTFLSIDSRMKEGDADELIIPGANAYQVANYGAALRWFNKAVERYPELIDQLHPYIDTCERVLATEKTRDDRFYESEVAAWGKKSTFAKKFSSAPMAKVRCKHCGHYTPYIDPNSGLAYLGTNNCQQCGRGYPVPDFVWDGVDGQAYIYYRHSVKEDVFYREFEERYDVKTSHRHFMAKE